MNTENTEKSSQQSFWSRPWVRILLSLFVGGAGVWFVTREVNLDDVQTALQQAHWGYVLLSAGIVIMTVVIKTGRWYLLINTPNGRVPYKLLLKVLSIGVFLNTLLPIARLGEISRIYLLDRHARKAQVLGTLVLEKSIEMVMLTLTLVIVLPLTILPNTINQPSILLLLAMGMFVTLYAVAYQAPRLFKIGEWLAGYLPERLAGWFLRLLADGLTGLEGLRGRRSALLILGLSTISTVTSVLTPYLLFLAFDIPLGIAAATLINAVVTFGSVPSSAPGNLGVLEFLVIATLTQLGLDNSGKALSYALLYHITTYLPVILLGSIAFTQTDWRPWSLLRQNQVAN
ncbi:MAG: flippase-like domain-containing protein [Anaerolineales bacterium]|nr:flippase-like domain-containing protein [Anaerolineales bacterium]